MRRLRSIDEAPVSYLLPDRGPVPDRPPSRCDITGHKGSVFYRAHSYHTKVPPEGIATLIEHYTRPGDIVLDPFCGSGMTGLACLITGRRGVLSDLSPAAVHIARGYTKRVDPTRFTIGGGELLARLDPLEKQLYGAFCRSCGHPGRTEYVIWSNVYACAGCGGSIVFWEAGLDAEKSRVREELGCDECGHIWRKRDLWWRSSVPVAISTSCSNCGQRTQSALDDSERQNLLSLDRSEIHDWYPTDPFESWREMWRGQHRDQGILSAADFFTTRNLWALATLWREINTTSDAELREAFRFVFTSVVNRASRRYQWNPKRPTNVLTSTMYVAALSYEFNVFSLLRRKLRSVADLCRATWSLPGTAEACKAPAQNLAHVPDRSVDYVFTDPPFGSNIFYADSSFLWEAWLGEKTDPNQEAVVNRSLSHENGGKSVHDYEKLMTAAFEEISRVLRPGAWASVMFHNSSDEVWSALQRASDSAGFEIGAAVAFDKSQPSFKGVKAILTGERVPSFDLVLHLRHPGVRPKRKRGPGAPAREGEAGLVQERLTAHLEAAPRSRRTTPYLHSLVMRILLEEGLSLEGWTYQSVEDLCARAFAWDGSGWLLRRKDAGQ
ncbi:MAG: DNA methyltransferase [Actinomycetota bacterium]